MFWGALSMFDSESELGKAAYGVLNLAMIFYGAAIGRRVLAVCGGIGVSFYLGHLAYTVFGSSLIFSFALMAIGLGIVFLGVWWQKNETMLQAKLGEVLPKALDPLTRRRL